MLQLVTPSVAATYPTIDQYVGKTPLVRLQRLPGNTTNVILCKLGGNNPAGSVKDRPAVNMLVEAERRGATQPGDTLMEATSGNTGIALAMAAAVRGEASSYSTYFDIIAMLSRRLLLCMH